MVRLVSGTNGYLNTPNKVFGIVYADTKNEVVPGVTIEELPDTCELVPGSFLYTASFETATLQSDNTWKWS